MLRHVRSFGTVVARPRLARSFGFHAARPVPARSGQPLLIRSHLLSSSSSSFRPSLSIRSLAQLAHDTLVPVSPFSQTMAAAPTLPQSVGNFDLLKRVKVKYGDVVISRWQSRVSGLTLVHIDYQGASREERVQRHVR